MSEETTTIGAVELQLVAHQVVASMERQLDQAQAENQRLRSELATALKRAEAAESCLHGRMERGDREGMLLTCQEVVRLDEEMTPQPWTRGLSPCETRDEVAAYFLACYDARPEGPLHAVVVPFEDKPLNEEALFTAITGNGPTSEANAIGIAHYRAAAPRLARVLLAILPAIERLRDARETDLDIHNAATVGELRFIVDKVLAAADAANGVFHG